MIAVRFEIGKFIAFFGLLFGIGLSPFAQTLKPDFAEAQEFLGGSSSSPQKATLVWTIEDEARFVHLHEKPLTVKTIASDGSIAPRSMAIAPNGKYVAYSVIKNSGPVTIIRKVEENTSHSATIPGTTSNPNWWVHPVTNKTYVLYAGGSIYAIEFDIESGSLVGEAEIFTRFSPADAGASYDGKYMAGENDDIHGVIEFEDFLDFDKRKPTRHIFMTSYMGWRSNYSHIDAGESYAGWCNANISPARDPQSKYYGMVQALGSLHFEIHLRTIPIGDDLNKPRELAADNEDCKEGKLPTGLTRICVPDRVVKTISTPANFKNFGRGFWSTHERYLVTGVGNKVDAQSKSWAMFIYDLEKDENDYLQMTNVLGDFYYPALWVEWDQPRVAPNSNSILMQMGTGEYKIRSYSVAPEGKILFTNGNSRDLSVFDALGRGAGLKLPSLPLGEE